MLRGWLKSSSRKAILSEEPSEIQVKFVKFNVNKSISSNLFLPFVYALGFLISDDPKNSHLRELEGANERLILCRADLNVYESLREAITGCDGVFHTASPVTDDPVSLLI